MNHQHNNRLVKKVIREVQLKLPVLLKYENGWPVQDMLAQYLHNSSQASKREEKTTVTMNGKQKARDDNLTGSENNNSRESEGEMNTDHVHDEKDKEESDADDSDEDIPEENEESEESEDKSSEDDDHRPQKRHHMDRRCPSEDGRKVRFSTSLPFNGTYTNEEQGHACHQAKKGLPSARKDNREEWEDEEVHESNSPSPDAERRKV
ncbi:hypothetical protein J3R82DRAFT_11953 [Butyriboletus roseoflavus]|nr:hypothetical protein J3R82DRAFT_11953 [Butyriboletus roseoflavus]